MVYPLFDVYIAVDWSARRTPSSIKPSHDALWIGEKDRLAGTNGETYWRTRSACISYLSTLLQQKMQEQKRVMIGFDLNFGFPAGFGAALGLEGRSGTWQAMWHYLSAAIQDDATNNNNRFQVASQMNSRCMHAHSSQIGPFWGCPASAAGPTLATKSPTYPFLTRSGQVLRKKRWTEIREPQAQPVWKLFGTASVGGQTLMGIPALAKLRHHPDLEPFCKIWPFETGFSPASSHPGVPDIHMVEIWPGLLAARLDKNIAIRDQAQVRATVDWLAEHDGASTLAQLMAGPKDLPAAAQHDCLAEEGWIIGSGISHQSWERKNRQ